MTKDMKRFTFRIPAHLQNELMQKANDMGLSLNSLCIFILSEYVEKGRKERITTYGKGNHD